MDSLGFDLTPFERRLMHSIERRGLRYFVLMVAAGSVLLSQLLTIPTLVLTNAPAADVSVGALIAFIVPSIVAPITALRIGRLLLSLARASTELQRLARTDSLTEVANRRAFAEEAADLWRRRFGRVAVLAMIDIDDFKAVNDRFGHATGDLALQTLAANLTDAVTSRTDAFVVGRLGGDEFSVVALVSDSAAAESLGAALVGACDLHPTCSGVTATAGWLTVSDRDGLDSSVDEALARADHALYAAKRPSSRHAAASNVSAPVLE